jgi:two-component system chemotaxis response regulator CheB
VLVVLHGRQFLIESFAGSLSSLTDIPVKLAEEGDILEEELILLAPGQIHTLVHGNRTIRLAKSEPVNHVRPSIDVTMKTIEARPKLNVVGVVLTGMGSDGAEGIIHLKRIGAATIAQDKESSAIYSMPKAAYETGDVDFVLPLHSIGNKIAALVESMS